MMFENVHEYPDQEATNGMFNSILGIGGRRCDKLSKHILLENTNHPSINSTFKDGGYTLCGPTAAADVIIYLWQNGYQNFQADNQAKTVNE
jgi:hypothetical protein